MLSRSATFHPNANAGCSVLLLFLLVLQESASSSLGRCQLSPPNYPEVAVCTAAGFHIIPNDLPPSITKLDLADNQIHSADNTLRHYSRLTHLSLARNSVRQVQEGSFASSSRLRFLSLSGNRLAGLEQNGLLGLTGLVELVLADNLLEALPPGVMQKVPALERLDLSGNRLRHLSAGALVGPRRLQSLSLADNELDRVPTEALESMSHLSELILDDNPGLGNRGDPDSSSFSSLTRLQTLSLRGCELQSVPRGLLDPMSRSLRTLDLSSNRLYHLSQSTLRSLMALREIRVGLNYLEDLDFLGPLRDLEVFVMNGCHHGLRLEVDGRSFADNLELRILNITKCPGLSFLPEGTLDFLPFLRVLNLRENLLSTVPESAADWRALELIDLTGNPLDCDCELAWLDHLLQERTKMPRPVCERPREFQHKVLGTLEEEFREECGDDGDDEGSEQTSEARLSAGVIVAIILGLSLAGAAALAYCCGPLPSLSGFAANASDDQKWTWRRRRKRSSTASRTELLRKQRLRRLRRARQGRSIEKHEIVVLPASVKDSSRYVDVIRSRETGLNEEAGEAPPPLAAAAAAAGRGTLTLTLSAQGHIYEELPDSKAEVGEEEEDSDSSRSKTGNFPDVKVSVL